MYTDIVTQLGRSEALLIRVLLWIILPAGAAVTSCRFHITTDQTKPRLCSVANSYLL